MSNEKETAAPAAASKDDDDDENEKMGGEEEDERDSSTAAKRNCLDDGSRSSKSSVHPYQHQHATNELSSADVTRSNNSNKEDNNNNCGSQNGADDDSLSSSSSSSSSSSATSSDSMTRLNEMIDEEDDIDDVHDDADLEDDIIEKEIAGGDSGGDSCPLSSTNVTTKSTITTASTSSSSSTVTTNTTTSTAANSVGNKSSSSSSSSNTGATAEESPESSLTSTDTRRRVKLYMLNANRTWDDRGTGHVSSSYIDHLNGMSLLVKAETDGSTLLESKIMADTAYQKQQDTLIVWSEGENYDLALSFQERIGCEEIWAKICQVQGKDPSVDITQDLVEDEDNELPPVEAGRLDEINAILASCLTSPNKKDNITLAFENDSNYIPKLLELFRELEDRQDIQSLQKMYEIFKNIFMFNKNSLIEIMLSDNAICDVIGVFEYDPNGARVREAMKALNSSKDVDSGAASKHRLATGASQQQQPSSSSTQVPPPPSSASPTRALSSQCELMSLVREKRHREFLRNVSRFKEVIPLSKSELVSKIHQTYRVQYIQDVIMPTPSVFEENMLSTLSSVLFFNKIEIVNLIQDDEKFLKDLFAQLSDDTPSFNEKRKDLVLFLKELCTFSHTLQNRESFIKTLSSLGLLQTVETLLVCDDPVIKLGAVDLLTYIVDYSPSMVREYALQQEINSDKRIENYIINIIIEQMICDTDPDLGMAQQLSGIMKMIIDPDNMLTTPGLNKTEKSEFLNYFYKHCIYFLTGPILAATVSNSGSGNQQSSLGESRLAFENSCQAAQLLSIILELLTFCIEHHAYHIRNYLLQKEIVRRIMILTKSRHTFLVLTVIRFMRKLVGLKDEFYNRHIVSLNLFQPIVEAFLSNKGRYNLLDSAVIDLFEFIDHNNIGTLLNYTVEKFWKNKLERVDYVRTFKSLKRHYDQQQHRNVAQPTLLFSQQHRNRFRRDARQLEKEEDMWFNTEDDDEEDECADDDDDDECENYQEDDDDGSPPLSQTSNVENRLTAGGSLSDPVDYGHHHHQYGELSLHHTKSSSPLGAVGSPVLHPLHLSSLHQVGGGGGSGANAVVSNAGAISSYNSLTATANPLYDTSAMASAFADSPFFSLASVAAATSGAGGVSGVGGNGKKKTNERKFTINLNHKTSSLLSTGGGNNMSSNNSPNNPQQQQQSANVLSAFSSGFCGTLSSINSSIAAVAAAANVTSPNSSSGTTTTAASGNHGSLLSSTSSSTPSLSSPFRTANQLMINQSLQAAAAAAAFHIKNSGSTNANNNKNTDSSTVSSRKALVDYPDEDSDEEEEDQTEDEELDDLENESQSFNPNNPYSSSTESSTTASTNKTNANVYSNKLDTKRRSRTSNNSSQKDETNVPVSLTNCAKNDGVTETGTTDREDCRKDYSDDDENHEQLVTSSSSSLPTVRESDNSDVSCSGDEYAATTTKTRKRKADHEDNEDEYGGDSSSAAEDSNQSSLDIRSNSSAVTTDDSSSSSEASETASSSSSSASSTPRASSPVESFSCKRFRYSFVESGGGDEDVNSASVGAATSSSSSSTASKEPEQQEEGEETKEKEECTVKEEETKR